MSNQILRFRCRECRLNLISPLPSQLPHRATKDFAAIEETQFRSMASVQCRRFEQTFRVSISLIRPMGKTLTNGGGGSKRRELMRRGESRILTKRMHEENRKSCFDDTQSNDKSGTRYIIVLDWSLLLIWYGERNAVSVFFLLSFHWFRWASSMFEIYIFLFNTTCQHRFIER